MNCGFYGEATIRQERAPNANRRLEHYVRGKWIRRDCEASRLRIPPSREFPLRTGLKPQRQGRDPREHRRGSPGLQEPRRRIFTDIRLPGRIDGVAERCREHDPEPPVIYATDFYAGYTTSRARPTFAEMRSGMPAARAIRIASSGPCRPVRRPRNAR